MGEASGVRAQPVCLVYLVGLVCFVCLVHLVCFVHQTKRNRTNERNQINKRDKHRLVRSTILVLAALSHWR